VTIPKAMPLPAVTSSVMLYEFQTTEVKLLGLASSVYFPENGIRTRVILTPMSVYKAPRRLRQTTRTLDNMCIIDPAIYEHFGKVRDIANTLILVAPEKGTGNTRQLTVYSNRVSLGEGTNAVAMILPVPNPGNDARQIRVIDTSDDVAENGDYGAEDDEDNNNGDVAKDDGNGFGGFARFGDHDGFGSLFPSDTRKKTEKGRTKKKGSSRLFDMLRPLTAKPQPKFIRMANSAVPRSRGADDEPPQMLPVEKSGSYEFTVVPSLSDFERVEASLLSNRPSPAVMKLLTTHYEERRFSFLVCKIAAGRDAQYHPLAYTHPVNIDGKMFVPTLHYHGEEPGRDFLGFTSPILARGHDQDLVQQLSERQRQRRGANDEANRVDTPSYGDEQAMRLHASQYKDVPDYDVHQDEGADYYRGSNEEYPHWDHEIYMLGVDPTEKFGRRAMVATQERLDSVLSDTSTTKEGRSSAPASYRKVLGQHPVSTFRFRRMLGHRFPNMDIKLKMAAAIPV